MRCLHPTRVSWRRGCLRSIRAYCKETRTYPHLTRLLVDGLESWFSGEDSPLLNQDNYPADLHLIISQQEKVGWKHLLLGRFVQEWRRVQRKYSECVVPAERSERPSTNARTSEQWLCGLIKVIWEQLFTLCEERHQDLHGRDSSAEQSHLWQEVNRQLRDIYAMKPFMDPKVRAFLLQDSDAHATQSLHVTRNWLRTNLQIFKENVRKVRRMALERMQSIRTFFRPISRSQHLNTVSLTPHHTLFKVTAIHSRVVVIRVS